MSWTWILSLYAIAGFICYIVAATMLELDSRAKGKHLGIDSYFTFSFIILIWPLCLVIVAIALFFILIMYICQKIADAVEKIDKKSVTICKEDNAD